MFRYLRFFIYIAFLFTSVQQLHAQSKKVWLYTADERYAMEDYNNALIYYKKVLNDTIKIDERVLPYEVVTTNQRLKKGELKEVPGREVPLTDYVNHQIAMSYRNIFDYEHAAEQFAISSESGYYPNDRYYLANAQMNLARYEDAIISFENFLKTPGANDSLLTTAGVLITGCHYAMNDQNVKTQVVIRMADSTFNKGTSAFGTMYFGDEEHLMFASARPGGVILDPEKQQSEYLLDVYWAEKQNDSVWGKAVNFGRPMNSAQHDASGTFNNRNTIYYNRWSDEDRSDKAIYLAREINLRFFEAYRLGPEVNVPGYRSINPFVTLDGRKLIFASDRPGGLGGMDLWEIALDSAGNTVGEAMNLGLPVNSEMDEVSPFFHEQSSTLFFSSNGHTTVGGLDIFKASYNKESYAYGTPVNMGMPINSAKDDAYLIFDRNLKKGFLSSDREPCEGGHCYDIYEVTNEPIRIFLKGTVYNAETNEVLANAQVTIKDVHGETMPIVITTGPDGTYSLELNQNSEVFVKAQKLKFFADAATVDTRPITETTTLTEDFYLNTIPPEEIEIEGIEYDFDSDKLRPISMEILDKLYDFLMLNDNLVVEINAHTDARGSDKYNQKLSERRAQSCVTYLISKGIDRDRLIPRGFGESSPNYLKDDNGDYVLDENGERIQLTEEYINSRPTEEEQEQLHQRNRRTSFKVIGEGFGADPQP